jgi:polysaccharide pyruvyl transferase WcaK-like protein
MNVTIIGWYGTETIGDRAILAGILTILTRSYDNLNISLGSLFPFFTERTINEDFNLWKKLTNVDFSLTMFDSKKPKELRNAIKGSDLLILGGGPIMHIPELYMIDYAFKKAKQNHKKTVVLGCGIGPLFKKEYHKIVHSIVKNSDLVFLRDSRSLKTLADIGFPINESKNNKITCSYDPAILPCLYFNAHKMVEKSDYFIINLREFPLNYSVNNLSIDEKLCEFIIRIASDNKSNILLTPMHYSDLGGDDRTYFYKLLFKIGHRSNVEVHHKPLNVEETMQLFSNAIINIGMRYHAILFQTLINGNNYIIDYTQPGKGKISGFLEDIDKASFYKSRYVNLFESDEINFEFNSDIFTHDLSFQNVLNNDVIKLKCL